MTIIFSSLLSFVEYSLSRSLLYCVHLLIEAARGSVSETQ